MELGEAPNLMVEPSTGAAFDLHPEVAGKRYQLLGVGVRKLFLAPLYSIGLAVESGHLAQLLERRRAQREAWGVHPELAEERQSDQRFFSAIIDTPVDKAAFLVFHHDLPLERAREAVAEGLRRALGRRDEGRIEHVLGLLTRDLQRGDEVRWRSTGNRLLTVELDGTVIFDDRLLARAFWVPFLGADPVSVSLKQRMARFLESRDSPARRAG